MTKRALRIFTSFFSISFKAAEFGSKVLIIGQFGKLYRDMAQLNTIFAK